MNYWRNVANVLAGTVIAQSIPLLGTLIITRLYAPTEFGIFSVWLGIVMLIAILITARYDMSLVIENDGEERDVAVLAIVLLIIVLSILLSVVALFAISFSLFESYSSLLVALAVPASFAMAMNTLWQSYAAASGNYKILNWYRITLAIAVTGSQILMGLYIATANTLALAQLIGLFISLFIAVRIAPITISINKESLRSIWFFLKKQQRFPKYSLPADFINTASAQMPTFIIASRYGAEIAGFFALSMRVLGVPIGLLGKSVLDVFKRYAAVAYKERGECREEYIKTLQVLTVGTVLFCIFMYIFNEQLFVLAFGSEWRESGVMAVWLLPLFGLRFVASPLSYVVYIVEKQHIDLVWQVLLLAVTLTFILLPTSYDLAIQSYSFGYASLYIIYLVMSYKMSLGRNRDSYNRL